MTVAKDYHQELGGGRRSLRTIPGSLLLGPTGARLWADYLEPQPGFCGRFDFIHKVNIPLLFTVRNTATTSFEPYTSEWFPSHLRWQYQSNRVAFAECKFITWDDCAVSYQRWTNRGDQELVLALATHDGALFGRAGNLLLGCFAIEHFSFDIDMALAVSASQLLDGLSLQPGETCEFTIAAAYGIHGQDKITRLSERAASFADSGRSGTDLLRAHIASYGQWFAKTPRFASSDPVLDTTWLYRWFLLRHNLADPRYGRLQYPLFYEGRSHKKSKRPFSGGGWEFSKLINLSVPLHLMDARWYHDPLYCEGSLQNMEANPGDDGQFCCVMVDTLLHSFANFSCWAAYQLYLVHRNSDLMQRLLPALKRQVTSWQAAYGSLGDELMIEYRHSRTGKEYQPSYWYFHQYPRNPKDPSTYTHLKRVDRSVYHYLNALGVAKLCDALGDPEAESFHLLTRKIRTDILAKMWDPPTQFFYDLHYETDEKAYVKNIVGFYPAWAELTDDRHAGLIEHLLRREEFNTGCPFPSTAADCPVYASEGGWQGLFIKGRNGCMWNGPTWPYTNSIALDALARESKRQNHRYDELFGHYLREYSLLHFLQRDLRQPYLVEHYSSRTGEPLSDEPDYNHSFYIDLIVSHVAGLCVEQDRIVLDPVDIGLDYFDLTGIKAAGVDIRVTFKRPGAPGAPSAIDEGYRFYVNDRCVLASAALQKREVPLVNVYRAEKEL